MLQYLFIFSHSNAPALLFYEGRCASDARALEREENEEGNCSAKTVKEPKKAKRNAHLANTDVPFDDDGYPDFSEHSIAEVKKKYTGSRAKDFTLANKAASYKKTPKGYTWHHHQDTETMQLIESKVHSKTGHDGGFSANKKH